MVSRTAWGCEPVEPVPETLQVAWISPLNQTVRGSGYIEVVRVRDLRSWIRANSAEPTRTLQVLGMLDRDVSTREAAQDYKITIFDVQRSALCRPVLDAEAGTDQEGVAVCEEAAQGSADKHHADGFTGCGYTLDTHSSVRGLDVFRVPWAEASAWGFCVMPLERFLEGA
jgi:hypothetical protein